MRTRSPDQGSSPRQGPHARGRAAGRVKQAEVLYDELLFEDGFVEIDITDGGPMHMWQPPEAATAERLERANERIEAGRNRTAPRGGGCCTQPSPAGRDQAPGAACA